MASDRSRLLTREQVAKALDISERTLSRMIARGEFPDGLEIGRRVRWLLQDVEAYLHLRSRMGRQRGGDTTAENEQDA